MIIKTNYDKYFVIHDVMCCKVTSEDVYVDCFVFLTAADDDDDHILKHSRTLLHGFYSFSLRNTRC